MSTNFILPPEFLTLAHRLADATHGIIRSAFRDVNLAVESKQDHSPVTAADRDAEMAIRDILGKERSGDGVLGEEYGHTQKESEWQWVVDPIDGTKAFTLGRLNFGCLIGLHHEQHGFVLGIADQAIVNDRWVGIKNGGATRNGQVIHAAKQTTITGSHIAITNPTRLPHAMHKMHDAIYDAVKIMNYGGNFLNYTGIADGLVHATFEAAQGIYDVAALVPLITEVGGVVTEIDGSMLTLNSKADRTLAACTPQLHAELLTLYKSF